MQTNVRGIATVIALLLCLGCAAPKADDTGRQSRLYRGELQVLIADDFKSRRAIMHYHLISSTDGAILRLIFSQAPPEPPLATGTRVEIRGRRHEMQLTVEALQVLPGKGTIP